jgi:DNA-binding MarR family transcriptional regulator
MAKKAKTYRRSYFEGDELYVGTYDAVTDRELSRVNASKKVPRKNNDAGRFYQVYERLNKVLKFKKDYSNLTFRLLFELLDRIELNNRIRTFRQRELGEILGSQQQNISVSLKVLEKDGVIQKHQYDYYFTPKFVKYITDANMPALENEPEIGFTNSESQESQEDEGLHE